MAEPADDILQSDGLERRSKGVIESLFGAGVVFTNQRLELREGMLDRIEVRTVRRQEQQLTAVRFDGLSYSLVLMYLNQSKN